MFQTSIYLFAFPISRLFLNWILQQQRGVGGSGGLFSIQNGAFDFNAALVSSGGPLRRERYDEINWQIMPRATTKGTKTEMELWARFGGQHSTMDSVLASHPAASGLIPSIPDFVLGKKFDVAEVYRQRCCLEQWTAEAWKCWSNPSSTSGKYYKHQLLI